MTLVIHILAYVGMGVLLGHMGFHAFFSWEFWAAMGLMATTDINSFIRGIN